MRGLRNNVEHGRVKPQATIAIRFSVALLGALLLAALPAPARAESPTPGGFVESVTATAVRPRVTPPLPARGRFTFPAPYNTTGSRITNADDCRGGDCLNY